MKYMGVRRLVLFSILLILVAGTAAALNPVNVGVTSSNSYLTANNVESSQITIMVTDGARNAIGGATVLLDVPPPWGLADIQGMTNAGGQFVTTFLPTTTSGTATITATVTVSGVTTEPVVGTYNQNIIADVPYNAVYSYPSTASVGSINDITVRITDRYGNPVTSKKQPNEVTFTTTHGGDGGFMVSSKGHDWWWWDHDDDDGDTKVKQVSVALNDSGYAGVDFAMNTRPGDNFVSIAPPTPVPLNLITIQGIANLPPATILQTVTPQGKPPTLTTDGTSKFIISYDLIDKYGNPSTRQNLSISTTGGEAMAITSNSEGKVAISYGPRTQAGRYTITARAQENSKVSVTQVVQFLSGKASNMLLTASPQTMASLDVKPDAVAWVTGKVIDASGNPVAGQTVSFSIQSMNTGTYNQTQPPALEADEKRVDKVGQEVSAVSDGDGIATVYFYPGAFSKDARSPGFSPLAEGSVKVQATWSKVTKTMDLSYKNFPYLSVYTSVEPETMETNGTAEVTIRVRGDGYALQPRPIDVYMVTDRSGSMDWDTPTRMSQVKAAATTFTTKFDYASDRLGQFSFGGITGAYTDYGTKDQALTQDSKRVTSVVSALSPGGYTPMRYAIYKAINELKASGRPDAVKALVVLSDGDYNYYGDPLKRGSESSSDPTVYGNLDRNYVRFSGVSSQNMAEYAKANNIRIYTIGYSADISEGGKATLEELARATGGKYYFALTGDDLTSFYTDIAGALKDTAGVNTNLALDFTNVEVTGPAGTAMYPGSTVLEYVPIKGMSTLVTPPATLGNPYTIDNSGDWTARKLNVQLGTIKVNQEWKVQFTMKIKKDGNVKIISSSSRVNYDDNQGSIPVPDTYITSIPAWMDKGLKTPKLEITNLHRINDEKNNDNALLEWNIKYDGNDQNILEEIEIAPVNSEAYSLRGTSSAKGDATSDKDKIDISDLRPGTYKARVTGFVSDAPSSSSVTEFTVPGAEARNPEILIR